jgi:pimeloyl-ACP methyl ester carboxylesterase
MEQHIKVATGVSLCTHIEGEGIPILLVMGISLQLIHWPPDLCAALVEEGFQVIRFDNRDAGLSTQLDDHGRPTVGQLAPVPLVSPPYTLDDMASDTLGLLDALGLESAHVVGVSMGGMIAQHMALRAPERIRSLSLIMTTPGSIYIPRMSALWGLMRPKNLGGDEAYTEAFLATQDVLRGPGSEPFTDEEWEAMRAAGREAWKRAPVKSEAPFLRQLAAILNAPNRSRKLRDLRVPTRLIHGACDPLVPPVASYHLAQLIPGSDLHLIHGMGHGLPQRHRKRVAGLLASHARTHEPAGVNTGAVRR